LPGWGKAVKHPHRRMKNSKFEQLYPSPAIGPDGIIYVASVNAGVFAIDGSSPLATPSGSVWPKFRHDMRNTGRVSGSK
jgi:hypothetical protein